MLIATSRGSGTPPAEVITIGDELVLGFTIDTNGAYLSRRLAEVGVAVSRRTSVGDVHSVIVEALREALRRTGMVITTGGLGPTTDDLSRAAAAEVFDRALELDHEHLEWMRERWRTRFGRDMPAANTQQAVRPSGSTKLVNNHGSAPGILIEDPRIGCVIMLPGVPRELRGMVDDTVIPLLVKRGGSARAVIRSRTIRTTGVAESVLGDQLRDLSLFEGMTLAYLPSAEGTDLRLTISQRPPEESDQLLADAEARVRAIVGESVYGESDVDLASIVLDLCRREQHTIAVAESCTGGLLGARLTAVPGSSDVFLGGVIAYHDDCKRTGLGVSADALKSDGAVSETVACQMAAGVRDRFQSTVALSITGIAGPGGATATKPIGTVWIGIAAGAEARARRFNMIGDREEIRRRSVQAALEMLRRRLV